MRFWDGDANNLSPENLIPVTRSEHLILNRTGYSHTPEPVRDAHIAVAKLKAKIIEVKKK